MFRKEQIHKVLIFTSSSSSSNFHQYNKVGHSRVADLGSFFKSRVNSLSVFFKQTKRQKKEYGVPKKVPGY